MTRLRRARLLAACGAHELRDVDDCPIRENNYALEDAIAKASPRHDNWQDRHAVAASLALDGYPARWPRDKLFIGRARYVSPLDVRRRVT